jgi:tRNA (mo5U34)-methyltransferase
MDGSVDEAALRIQVDEVRWYHSIELPGGIVTPGSYDLRSAPAKSLFPESLAGRRCLDVGTHDGFWAFLMEQRGASDVVAIDVNDPEQYDLRYPRPSMEQGRADMANRRRAFDVAHRALGSKVERKNISVYDVTPDEVGTFDFAFIGTLLHHLRDPVGALLALRRVVTGELIVNSVFSVSRTVLFPRSPAAEYLPLDLPAFWTIPNLVALRRQVSVAGWNTVRSGRPYLQRYGARAQTRPPLRPLSDLPRRIVLQFGAPHIALVARPA